MIELWSLREDVGVEADTPGGPLLLRGPWGDVTVPAPSPVLREALRRMSFGPVSLGNVAAPGAVARLYPVLRRLQPMIVRSLGTDSGQPLLSVVPMAVTARFSPDPVDPGVPVRMSRFASLRTDGAQFRVESPLSLHRVVLHRPEAAAMLGWLSGPATPGSLPPLVTGDVIAYLAGAGIVVRGPDFAEDRDQALTGWSPADLAFHVSSTLGRHDHDFGITYPAGATPAEPAVKPPAARAMPLHAPAGDTGVDLAVAIESRRSVRSYQSLVTAAQIGDLLYRTARVRSLRPAGQGGYELSDRPYPSGGACYELELYLAVGSCAGLDTGVYHYDPLGHRIEPLDSDPAELLGCARVAAGMTGQPQVLIVMTARFRRVSWKYEGLAYRLVVAHVGVMMQNLYLVCTAMRLAPCALGSVSIEAAARALGADWRTEPCVGQFLVGGR